MIAIEKAKMERHSELENKRTRTSYKKNPSLHTPLAFRGENLSLVVCPSANTASLSCAAAEQPCCFGKTPIWSFS